MGFFQCFAFTKNAVRNSVWRCYFLFWEQTPGSWTAKQILDIDIIAMSLLLPSNHNKSGREKEMEENVVAQRNFISDFPYKEWILNCYINVINSITYSNAQYFPYGKLWKNQKKIKKINKNSIHSKKKR